MWIQRDDHLECCFKAFALLNSREAQCNALIGILQIGPKEVQNFITSR